MNLSQKLAFYIIYPLLVLVLIIVGCYVYINVDVAFWVSVLGSIAIYINAWRKLV